MSFPGVAVVIGAGSGIGRVTAKLFAKRGCTRIAIADLKASGLAETKQQMLEIQAKCEVVEATCDVTSEDSVNDFFSKVASKFGRIDYACNLAGIVLPGATAEYSVASFEKQLAVNATGMWICQKAEILQMLKQEPIKEGDSPFLRRGAIANVASMAGLRSYDILPAYCASKHAVIGFTKADGLQYGAEHIRVNAVCPGVIETPMLGEIDPNEIESMTSEMAMGRLGQPEEIAEAMLWLVSSQSSFVTATTLAVNGGMVGA